MWNVAVHVNIVQANFNILESPLKIYNGDYKCKIFKKRLSALYRPSRDSLPFRGSHQFVKTSGRPLLAGVWPQKSSDLFIISALLQRHRDVNLFDKQFSKAGLVTALLREFVLYPLLGLQRVWS